MEKLLLWPVVGRGREEQLVLEAEGQCANGSGELGVDFALPLQHHRRRRHHQALQRLAADIAERLLAAGGAE